MASPRPYNLTVIPGPISATTNSNGQKTFMTRASLITKGRQVECTLIIPARIHAELGDQLSEGREIALRCFIEPAAAEGSATDHQILTAVAVPRATADNEDAKASARTQQTGYSLVGLRSANLPSDLPQRLLLLS
ncbi:MAG: hypothetical protein CL949_20440 [Erythrobacter sp.]|nr:hypothetical protein [Erythrobacter sp.]